MSAELVPDMFPPFSATVGTTCVVGRNDMQTVNMRSDAAYFFCVFSRVCRVVVGSCRSDSVQCDTYLFLTVVQAIAPQFRRVRAGDFLIFYSSTPYVQVPCASCCCVPFSKRVHPHLHASLVARAGAHARVGGRGDPCEAVLWRRIKSGIAECACFSRQQDVSSSLGQIMAGTRRVEQQFAALNRPVFPSDARKRLANDPRTCPTTPA